ncbi:MarR family winged helix-turn-helix transcriptional regulator [Kitasatospora sp. NPDC006697]|uniref:MarR family winged helix-turn-helix transcriptional regulator n=1 Tax=Kitasatospora sp. NPDC006697 TaxID=3364020 RepID=UPI0036BA3DA8
MNESGRREPATEGAAQDFDAATVARLRLVVARLYRRMAQSSPGAERPAAQLSALARIEQHGPLRLGELAALEGVAAPSITRTLGPLLTDRLVERLADPTDGRSSLVRLSAHGRELLDQVRQQRSSLLARRIATLTEADREVLRTAVPVLERLVGPDGS